MNPLSLLVAGCFFMEFLDGTIIAPALPQMAISLGSTAVDLHVGISAYLLTVAVMILPGGWAAERFGGRTVFASAIVIFTAASGLCALAGSLGLGLTANVPGLESRRLRPLVLVKRAWGAPRCQG